MSDAPVLLAVDGNSLVHRSFHAQASTGLRSATGRPMWAVRGLLLQLTAAVERVGATAVVVGFDDPEYSSRRERWPQYKAARIDKLDTLVDQLLLAAEVLAELGVAVVVPPGLEADDVLASAARLAPTIGACTVVATSDRDAFALIDDHTRVLRILNGGVESSPLLTADRLELLTGIRPHQYRDFAALRGDPSDCLPGVRGIGPKTAARLLAALGSARAAFDDLDGDGAAVVAAVGPAAARALADPSARGTWELNCQVMTMRGDLALALDLSRGPGVLPFAVDTVRRIFTGHQLTASMTSGLRALAHHCTDSAPPPRYVSAATADGDRSHGTGHEHGTWTSDRPRPIRRPPARVAAQQLSLF